MKKALSFVLVLVIMLSLIPFSVFATDADHMHTYGEWSQVTAPTCDAEGQDKRICASCGDTQYRDTRITGDPNKILVSNPIAEDFFDGKILMAIGDSLTAGTLTTQEERYHYLTAQALGMTNINSGTSGATLCPGGYLPNKFDTLMTVELLTKRKVDVVTIFLGVNDWNNGVLNGTYRGSLKYDPEDTWYDLGEFGTDDTTTIYGAAKMWCERILELKATEECKDIQFVFMTPVILSRNRSMYTKDNWNQDKTNVFGYTLREYCTAIMEVCAYYDIPVLDLNMYSGMYYHNETDNNVEEFGGDGIHPGPNGHAMMAAALTEFLQEGYTYENRTMTNCGHSYVNGACEECYLPAPSLTITKQPENCEAKLGERYMVEVLAEGEGLTYQWYGRNAGSKSWFKSSVKDNTYDDVMTEARAGREVYCVITDANGNSVTTNTVKLICLPSEKLEIVTQPTDGEAVLGERYCVTVEAKGEGLKYQWYFRNKGATHWTKSTVTDNTYDDVMTTARAGREVYCVITDAVGNTVTTEVAKLVRVASEELAITKQPTNGEAVLGENYCVTVEAKGEGLKYQWYFRNAGAKEFSKSSVRDNTYDDVMTTARAGREVYCVITDALGNSVTTDIVKLISVPAKLEIITQPTDATAAFDEMFCATVEAKGEGLKYQWYYRNTGSDTWHKSGVRDNTYDDIMTKARNGREVYCVITDKYGNSVTTDIVKLIAVPKVELKLLGQSYENTVMGERFCVTVEAEGEGLTYQWYFRNAGATRWSKSGVKDNTYDDVMNKTRANREVYCVITDAFGNQVVTEVVTLYVEKN